MKICLVGSILRHTISSEAGEYSGWGGMTESAVAPFTFLLDAGSMIHFVGSVGEEDIGEVKAFLKRNYPFVNTSGIRINPTGTDYHYGNKNFVKVKLKVEPTEYKHIEPYIQGADVVIFNFGNIDDIDPGAIKKVKQNSQALVYVDVHRKPFGVDEGGYIYGRGWPNWEKYLHYADVVQMNRNECEVLFQKKVATVGEFIACARQVLDVGVRQVLLTLGSSGVLLGYRSPSYRYVLAPIIPSRAVDTTGCGDAFAAGYLVGIHEGRSFLEALKLGSLMASINCEFVGYMKDLDRQTIEKRMPINFNLVQVNPEDRTLSGIRVA